MRRLWLTGAAISLFVACSGSCSGDDAHRHPTARPTTPATATPDAAPPVPPGTPAPLSEDMATPYFPGEAATAFALEKWPEAKAGFTKLLATAKGQGSAPPAGDPQRSAPPAGDNIARLQLLLGLVHARLQEWGDAAAQLELALKGLPQLADYIRYHAARALYFAHQMDRALEHAKAVASDSIVGADAELLVGDLLQAQAKKDPAAVAAHYKGYLIARPNGMRRSEARYRLAEALEQSGGDPKEIVELYRRIGIDDPLSSWRGKAAERLVALKPKLPAELQKFDVLTATESIATGRELFEAMRNPESEAAFDSALGAKDLTPEQKCDAAYHKAQSRFKARDRKNAAPMFDDAAAACKDAKNTDLEIKSLYQAGRSWSFIGQHETATRRYQDAQKIDPSHSYSDDALLREGEEWWARGDKKQIEAVLSSLPVKFPKGDNVAEAMWRLGWGAWRDKQYDAAIKWWQKQIELVPHDDNYFGEGQAQYWLGRAYLAKGKKAEALDAWDRAIRQYPAAYYAMLSLNRMRETDAKRYAAIVAEISTDPKGYDPKAPAFTFQPRVEYSAPGFQRALEFLRLGLGSSAEAELRKLGLTAPRDKKRVDDPDRIEKLWAMAFLADRAGRHEAAHWPTRWHILDYRKQWPIGANRARWIIGYPLAYQELLARHAQTNKVPFAMQIAIVREESAFDPLLESYANAIGLTQMIAVTAERFAKGTGIQPTRENLRDPEKNVTIGSRFLGYLFDHWKNFIMFVPPSYNGGEGYVRRNLKTRGDWDVDEFIEGILDDQIRNYSKRVLGTFFTYSWLYDKKVPEIVNTIPAELLPKK